MEEGSGAGSRKGWDEDSPGWKELIVVAAVGVVSSHGHIAIRTSRRLRAYGPGHSHFRKRCHNRDALRRLLEMPLRLWTRFNILDSRIWYVFFGT